MENIILEDNIYSILSYSEEGIGSELRRDWINHVRSYGGGVIELPPRVTENSALQAHTTFAEKCFCNNSR